MDSTVTANFEHPSAAEDAATALLAAGVPRDDVLVFPAESDEFLRAQRLASPNHVDRGFVPPEVGAALGFTLGFLGGGFLGLLLGTGLLNVMGREPAMAVGPFWASLIGALVLGAAGALAGYIANVPLPALDPAPESPRTPRLTVVSVSVPADRAVEVVDSLAAMRPRDVTVWRRSEAGWMTA